jgi:hypothetical protein
MIFGSYEIVITNERPQRGDIVTTICGDRVRVIAVVDYAYHCMRERICGYCLRYLRIPCRFYVVRCD